MDLNIGGTISKLRKEKALTQEQLSDIFGVSVAAVSKWETGTASPDITLLPVIAGFFDISVDRLLGYEMNKSAINIDQHLAKAAELLKAGGRGNEKEAIAYLGNLAYRYPNNVKVLVKYAEAKIQSGGWNPSAQAKKKLFKEAEEILRSINTNGLTRNERDSITKALYGLYLFGKKFDKVAEVLSELKPDDDSWNDYDNAEFWFYTHKGYTHEGDMEKAREKYFYILEKTLLNEALIAGQYHFYYNAPEKVIGLNSRLIKTIYLFIEEFSSFPYETLLFLHECNAFMYARLGQNEEALNEVEIIAEYSVKAGVSHVPFSNLVRRKEADKQAYDFIQGAYEKLMQISDTP